MRDLIEESASAMPSVAELRPDDGSLGYGLSWQPRTFEGSSNFEWGLQALLDGMQTRAVAERDARGRLPTTGD